MSVSLRNRLFFTHLGLWIVCNAAEAPAWPVTLNLFPGRGNDDVDLKNSFHVGLTTPQVNYPGQEDTAESDLITKLSLGSSLVPSNIGKNTHHGFRHQQASLVPVLPDAVAGYGSDPFHCEKPMTDPHEVQSQNPTSCPEPAQDIWTSYSLPTTIENVNLQTSYHQVQKAHSVYNPTLSGVGKDRSLQSQINPSPQFSINQDMTDRSSSKRLKNVSHQGLSYSGVHYQHQAAKRVKFFDPSNNRVPIKSSPIGLASNQLITGAEGITLGMTDQMKDGVFTGYSCSSSKVSLESWSFLLESAKHFGNRAAPHLSSTKLIMLAQQPATKPTEILKFDANIFKLGQNSSEKDEFKLESICSLVEMFQGANQLPTLDSQLAFFKMQIHNHLYPISRRLEYLRTTKKTYNEHKDDKNQRQKLQSDALKEFQSNEMQWFMLWEKRAGNNLEEKKDISLIDRRGFALLLFYIDMIGTLLQKYYPTDSNDPSLTLLKKAIELAEPRVQDKTYSLHKFGSVSNIEKKKGNDRQGVRPFTVNWNWISTVIVESGQENLRRLLFQDRKNFPNIISAFFNDIFFYSIKGLNERLKTYSHNCNLISNYKK
ncbi:hypothetical protein PGT21_034254 [Puccinia graminis f. sp. tritici]|uniref:Uncharacterized protein n=1 Tax=Puccinia graminis f. sp. tritici TaxID=56615 RepID=A0A5B0QCG9_PUCGR|nr:hypothetical protein PGT21_034254 [Puccinia graminis f. sp. tritici]